MFPPPEPVEIPDHLTAEKTLEIFRSLVSGMETALREMLSHAKSEGITDANQAMQEFQHLYIEHVEQITSALLKTHGITQEVGGRRLWRLCRVAVDLQVPHSLYVALPCLLVRVCAHRSSRRRSSKPSRRTTACASRSSRSTRTKPRRASAFVGWCFRLRKPTDVSHLVPCATCRFRNLGLKVEEP